MQKMTRGSVAVALAASMLALPSMGLTQQARPEIVLQVGHTDDITGSPSVSADGRFAVTMDRGRQVLLWDMADGRQLRRMITAETAQAGLWFGGGTAVGATRALHGQTRISPDGRLVAATAYKGTTVWELHSGKRLHYLESDSINVIDARDIAFSPDSRRLVVPRTISYGFYVWDVETGSKVYDVGSSLGLFGGQRFGAFTLAWSPDGKYIVGGGSAHERNKHWVRVHDADSGRELQEIEFPRPSGPGVPVGLSAQDYTAAKFSNDARLLALGGSGKVWLHEVGTWKLLATLDVEDKDTTEIAFSPDGKQLTATGSSGGLRRWDLASLAPASVRNPSPQLGGGRFALTPDGAGVVAVQGRRLIHASVGAPENATAWGTSVGGITAIATSPSGKHAAIAAKGRILIWDLASGTQALSFASGYKDVDRLIYSPDGTWLVGRGRDSMGSFSSDGGARAWSAATGEQRFTVEAGARDMAISRDGKYLVTASGASRALLWSTERGEPRGRFQTGKAQVRKVAVSPDGRWVAAATSGERIYVWEASSGIELPFLPERWLGNEIGFDAQGALLVQSYFSNRTDARLSKWDVAEGREIRRYPDPLYYARNASDGKHLAMCCVPSTGLIKMLDLDSGNDRVLGESRFVGGGMTDMAMVPDGRHLMMVGTDATVRILDHVTGNLVATLMVFPESNDWIVTTPDGLFDGSPAAWEKMLWRFSAALQDVASPEAYFNEFFHPGLLADVFAARRPKAKRDIASIDRRQPRVNLEHATPSGNLEDRRAKVRVTVAEAPAAPGFAGGSGIRDVRLFRNGVLIKAWRGEVAGGTLEAEAPVVAGNNEFTAYAFNRENVRSAVTRLTLRGADSLARAPRTWILALGVDKHENPGFDLRFAGADAIAFADGLKAAQSSVGAAEQVRVVTLRDADATKRNLLAALNRLAGAPAQPADPPALSALEAAQPEDSVFIFFAGHGLAEQPRFYLVPHDLGYKGARDGIDDVAMKSLLARSISDLELEPVLERIDARRITLVIDACHSGQALESEEKRRGPMNSRGLAQLAYEKGMYIITASQSYQAALEFDALGHGLLTHALVAEGLAKGQADHGPKDGRIELREWLDFAVQRVPAIQLDMMKQAAARGRTVAVTAGDERIADPLKRLLQQPRVFYRREIESSPFIVRSTPRS